MATSDLSGFTEGMNGLQGMAFKANWASNGVLFTGACVVFFLIILMALIRNEKPFDEAITVSAWVMFVISGLLWLAKLVDDYVPVAFFIIALLGVLYLYSSRQ